MVSLARPVSATEPSGSSIPRSPVSNQPSALSTLALASGLPRYPPITWGPRTSTRPCSRKPRPTPDSGSTMRNSVSGIGRPELPRMLRQGLRQLTTGLVSVRP